MLQYDVVYYFPGEFIENYYRADDGEHCDGWIQPRLWLPLEEAIYFLKRTELDDRSPRLASAVRLAVNACMLDHVSNLNVKPQMAHELVRIAEDSDYPVTFVPKDSFPGSNMDVLHSMLDFSEETYNK